MASRDELTGASLLDPDAEEREAERIVEGAPTHAPGRRPLPLLVLETMRPKQWIKNTFVFAGLFFSGMVTHLTAIEHTLLVFAAFCLASGATYLLNDALDAEADRHNPRTASRPIARGDLPVRVALTCAAVAAAVALGMAALLNWESLAVLGGYVILQLG